MGVCHHHAYDVDTGTSAQSRWNVSPRACRHRPLQGGRLWAYISSAPGVGTGGPLPEPILKAAEHTHCRSVCQRRPGRHICWLFRTRCFLLNGHYKAIRGIGGVCTGGGKAGIECALGDMGVGRTASHLLEEDPSRRRALAAGFFALKKIFHIKIWEPPERKYQIFSNKAISFPVQTPSPSYERCLSANLEH